MSLLNDAVLRDHPADARFLTALFAELTHQNGDVVLEIAAAGHPAPFLVLAGGAVEPVAVQGPVVGVSTDVTFEPVRVTLAVGDKIVLYTDGLADARAPEVMLSDLDIADLLADARDLEGQELAQFLESRATAGAQARDDIAILVLEAVGPGASALSVHYNAATN
jgi:serine phosphatase RsbU (regulator of sigma subunit)